MVFVQGWASEILNVAHLSWLRVSFHWLHQDDKQRLLCLGAHAQARYTVVCLCVCVDCYSCSRINEVQVRVSIGF